MADQKDLVRTVRRIAEERFPPGQIHAATVVRDVDFDGDAILMVTIIFDDARAKGGLDAKLAIGLTRHLRLGLEAIGETSFPVVSFVSRSEFGELTPEAA